MVRDNEDNAAESQSWLLGEQDHWAKEEAEEASS